MHVDWGYYYYYLLLLFLLFILFIFIIIIMIMCGVVMSAQAVGAAQLAARHGRGAVARQSVGFACKRAVRDTVPG